MCVYQRDVERPADETAAVERSHVNVLVILGVCLDVGED